MRDDDCPLVQYSIFQLEKNASQLPTRRAHDGFAGVFKESWVGGTLRRRVISARTLRTIQNCSGEDAVVLYNRQVYSDASQKLIGDGLVERDADQM